MGLPAKWALGHPTGCPTQVRMTGLGETPQVRGGWNPHESWSHTPHPGCWGPDEQISQPWACPHLLVLLPQVSCSPAGPRPPWHLVEGAPRPVTTPCLPQTPCSQPPLKATPAHSTSSLMAPSMPAESPGSLGQAVKIQKSQFKLKHVS